MIRLECGIDLYLIQVASLERIDGRKGRAKNYIDQEFPVRGGTVVVAYGYLVC
jgi:hypothetical protein